MRFSARLKALDDAHPLARRTLSPAAPAIIKAVKRKHQVPPAVFPTRLRRTDRLLPSCPRPALIRPRFSDDSTMLQTASEEVRSRVPSMAAVGATGDSDCVLRWVTVLRGRRWIRVYHPPEQPAGARWLRPTGPGRGLRRRGDRSSRRSLGSRRPPSGNGKRDRRLPRQLGSCDRPARHAVRLLASSLPGVPGHGFSPRQYNSSLDSRPHEYRGERTGRRTGQGRMFPTSAAGCSPNIGAPATSRKETAKGSIRRLVDNCSSREIQTSETQGINALRPGTCNPTSNPAPLAGGTDTPWRFRRLPQAIQTCQCATHLLMRTPQRAKTSLLLQEDAAASPSEARTLTGDGGQPSTRKRVCQDGRQLRLL